MLTMLTIGRYFFAGAIMASGFQQLVTGSFVRLVPKLPIWFPWPVFWAGSVGVVLIFSGVAIIGGYKRRWAATVVGALLLLSFLFQRVPEIVSNPLAGFIWTNPFKVLALFGGALILRSMHSKMDATKSGWFEKSQIPMGAWLLGIFLVICGAQHFAYASFVDALVPDWIPPTRRFWTYLAGIGLLAGGLGVFISRTRRLATAFTGVMVFLWVVLLHIPRVATEADKAFELGGVFEALAISGVAFLLAGQHRGMGSSERKAESARGK